LGLWLGLLPVTVVPAQSVLALWVSGLAVWMPPSDSGVFFPAMCLKEQAIMK